MKCEDCPNAEWDCMDGHWYIYGCMGECEEDEAEEDNDRQINPYDPDCPCLSAVTAGSD